MTIRDIFVPLAPAVDCTAQFDIAGRLALRLNARVDVVFTRTDAAFEDPGIPDMLAAAGVIVEAVERESKLTEAWTITQFEHWRAANGLAGATLPQESSHACATWHEKVGSVTDTIVETGRVSDLTVIGKPGAHGAVTEQIFTAAIYSTGHPAVIVPHQVTGDHPLDHILIAWNGSLEAARAVAGAMPLLEAARRVSIFSVPENPKASCNHLGLIRHLEQHGVHAEWIEPSSSSGDLGRQLVKTAADASISMIVMGAYSHHRVSEAFLGGATRHVLETADIPVLMMH